MCNDLFSLKVTPKISRYLRKLLLKENKLLIYFCLIRIFSISLEGRDPTKFHTSHESLSKLAKIGVSRHSRWTESPVLKIHSVLVIRTVRLTGTPLPNSLSGLPLTGPLVIRITGSCALRSR